MFSALMRAVIVKICEQTHSRYSERHVIRVQGDRVQGENAKTSIDIYRDGLEHACGGLGSVRA